jgi:hypothetical protein
MAGVRNHELPCSISNAAMTVVTSRVTRVATSMVTPKGNDHVLESFGKSTFFIPCRVLLYVEMMCNRLAVGLESLHQHRGPIAMNNNP